MELCGERLSLVSPLERMCVLLVIAPNIRHNLRHKGLLRAPNSSLKDGPCKNVEPDFNLIKPRGIGRREVQMQAATLVHPIKNIFVFMGAQIVSNYVQFSARVRAVKMLEEIQKIHVVCTVHAAPLNRALVDRKSGKQAGGAIALIGSSQPLGVPRPHRQKRLGSVQRLNLGLFIHAQNNRIHRRLHIQPNDCGLLGGKFRIRTFAAPVAYFMRLQVARIKYTVDRRDGISCGISQLPYAPASAAVNWSRAGKSHHFKPLLLRDDLWTTTARRNRSQGLEKV